MEINRFTEGFIENFTRECKIVEPGNYTVKFRLPRGSVNGLKINLPKIKEHSMFLKSPSPQVTPPKDCDSILLDFNKNTFYLIEIKSMRTTCRLDQVKKQLAAGFEWLKFLCFCLDINIEDYTILNVYTIVNSQANNTRHYELKNGIYRTYGTSIYLDNI